MENGGLDPTVGAILPLVGVALGAALSIVGSYVLKRRDERRETRAVARLLLDELTASRNRIRDAIIVGGTWLTLTKWVPPTEVWHKHGLLLARHLDKDDIVWLRAAYASLAVLPGLLVDWPARPSGRSGPRARSTPSRRAEPSASATPIFEGRRGDGFRMGDCCSPSARPMTVVMKSTALDWEQTLVALLPLVGRRLRATTLVDEFPVSSFGGLLDRVDVEPAPVSRVEQAELNFADMAATSCSAATSTCTAPSMRTACSASTCRGGRWSWNRSGPNRRSRRSSRA